MSLETIDHISRLELNFYAKNLDICEAIVLTWTNFLDLFAS